MTRFLTALPVYNEAHHVEEVLEQVKRFSPEVLVVDDGSTDGTPDLVASRHVRVATHARNLGYGAALRTAFEYAVDHDYDVLVTIDCDGQHEPQLIPAFVEACQEIGKDGRRPDIVSGSRYLKALSKDAKPPAERRRINLELTALLNDRLKLNLTDAFCGFKAYRVGALSSLSTRENGYGMPLELWVKASVANLKIIELPVPLVYLEEKRSFGGALDDGQQRLNYYYGILEQTLVETTGRAELIDRQILCGESTE